jgi:hypothetical protein
VIFTARALNRTVLARQLLLARARIPIGRALERAVRAAPARRARRVRDEGERLVRFHEPDAASFAVRVRR